MKTIVLSLAKKLAYLVAAFIILIAILVCASRLLTPVLDKHKSDVEQYASTFLQTPVKIDKVGVSWFQYQPVISLDNVTILNKANQHPSLQIKNARVFFSLWQSVWQRKVVPSGIMISGADLNIHEAASGEIKIQGFPALGGFQNTPYDSETKLLDMLAWLSAQPLIILSDIDLKLTRSNGEVYALTLSHLRVSNTETKHRVSGKVILRQEIPTEASLALEWQGKEPDLNKIKANVYLYVSGFSLSQWLKKLSYDGWEIKKGIASAKIWLIWDQGSLRKVQTTLQAYGLRLFSANNQSTHVINRLSGNVGWKRQGQGQVIAGDDILIDLPQHLWPVTSFYVSLMPSEKGELIPKTATLGYVDISDLQDFLFAAKPFLSNEIQSLLKHLQIKGALQNATFTFGTPWDDVSQLKLNATLSQVSASAYQQWPGVNHLTGSVRWNENQGELTLNTNHAQLLYGSVFHHPIQLDEVTGSVQVKRAQDEWQFSTSNLHIFNNDAAFNLSGTLNLPAKGSPLVDLNANFTVPQASHIIRYLPLAAFDKDLIKWLQQAFLAGEVKSGRAILKGALADFPFDKNNGTFSIIGVVNHVDLSYAPGWPLLKHINGKIAFIGRRIDISVDRAEIMGIPINHVKAEIPYIGEDKLQVLSVASDDIPMDFVDGMKFIHASPLEKTIGRMFSEVELSGPTQLKLNLTVPLSKPDQTTVLGELSINNAMMHLKPWQLNIDQLHGEIQFTEDTVTASDVKGNIFDEPLSFSLASVKKSDAKSIVRASFETQLKIKDLENWLQLSFSPYAEGSTAVKGEIDLALDAPIEFRLKSDLKGVAVQLPDDFSKKAETSRDFSLAIFVAEKHALKLKVNYGKDLSAALLLDRKNNQFAVLGANVLLGTGSANWPPTEGLYLSAHFVKLDWDKIKNYMGEGQATSTHSIQGLKLKNIDIRADTLNLAGLELEEIHLQMTPIPDENAWKVTIDSPDITGAVQVPIPFNRDATLTAQFQRLHLPALTDNKTSSLDFEVKSLPSISFAANDVIYNNIPVGQVNFKTSPGPNGLVIRSLSMQSRRLNLQSSGEWTQSGKTYLTRLQGKAESSRVSDLLLSFGLDVRNFIASDGKLNFNLSWRDAPFAPSLSNLNGRASMNLGAGRIVDIGEEGSGAKVGVARMLSIFSLQTIPRRLSLNFSDVFQKGYSFDSIRGDFSFQNGDAYTNNLRFDGPIAHVGINGRIGLKNKDYNFTLSVTPDVTSNLTVPVAATIFGGPIAGAATLAVSTILGSQISKAVATYYYVVTGPWDNPNWKSVNSDQGS